MKRTPLKRSGQLARRTPDIPAPVRAAVADRSGGRCERAGCTERAAHMHHVLRRSQGGTHTPTNLAHLCATCHMWVHRNPNQARAEGLLTRPETTP